MKNITQKVLVALSASVFLFIGCGKDGAVGPQGDPGNANVIPYAFSVSSYSAWSNTTSFYYLDLPVPALTPGVLGTAAVEVYFSTNNGTTWEAIPFTQIDNGGNYFMGYTMTAGDVEIHWQFNGIGLGDDPNTYYNATILYKVVVIPPAAMKIHPKVNYKNYNEVKQTFSLSN